MLDGVQPITDAERYSRVDKARRLMRQNKLDAIFLEAGTSLYYFSGTRFQNSETPTGLIVPVEGEPIWIVPSKGPQAGSVKLWKTGIRTTDAPFETIAQAFKDRKASNIGFEEQVRFFVFDGVRQQMPQANIVSATPVTAGCRMIKSPAEIALMQRASDITIAAYKAALAHLKEGMSQVDLRGYIEAAYTAFGVRGDVMAEFGKYTAFPHGSITPQRLREGDFVLIDDGCSVEGYQSDITRTVIFGQPTARQRQIWELERQAQAAAFNAAQPGHACETVDAAARKVITGADFGPDYKLPGLPHRTGHGIGLDGHEWTNFVRGNKTPMQPGMCFSDEPMIAIYGEFGVRLEDCLYITDNGPRMFSKPSLAIDQPFG